MRICSIREIDIELPPERCEYCGDLLRTNKMSTKCILSQIDAARREGRLETVTQRQKEIQAIHEVVRKRASELHHGLLAADATRTEIDVLMETAVALQLLMLIFDQLSLKVSLAEERLPQQGKSNQSRHDPLGNILILSDDKLPLSSALVPLAYAIAAGNNPIVILSPILPAFSKKLYDILKSSSLDLEAIGLFSPESESSREQIISELQSIPIHAVFTQGDVERKLVVAQSFHKSNPHVRLTLVGTDVNLAIVTRNTNVQLVAKEIVQANYGYGTTSAAAPGVVFVDEFVTQNFVQSLQKAAQDIETSQQNSIKFKPKQDFNSSISIITDFKRQGGEVIKVGNDKVLLIGDPDWKSLKPYELALAATRSRSSGILCLIPTTSLEGAITLSVQLSSSGNTVPSLFIFADPSEAQYLAQFVPSSATYINHIPIIALFTPPPHLPFKSLLNEVFAKPHPVLVNSSTMLPIPGHIFEQPTDSLIKSLNSVLAAQKLGPPKQKSGKQTSFFAQGGLMGLSHLFMGVAVTTYGLLYLKTWVIGRFE